MIPILYDNAERRFVTNGICRLSDCASFTVTEERNGIYEAEFVYPITGQHYDEIQLRRVVYCTHDDSGVPQAFDIYAKSAPIDGLVTFYAHHISYRLADVVVAPFSASGCQAALTGLSENAINANGFSFWTDKETAGDFTLTAPDYARAILGGQENSILDVFGQGDYEFDMFTVKLHADRGTDSGVEIRYGKNLVDVTHEVDDSATYNAVVPYWLDPADGTVVMLPEKILVYSGATIRHTNLTDEDLEIIRTDGNEPIEVGYQIVDAKPLDLSSDFSEQPTEEELRTAAEAYLTNNKGWEIPQNITIDFVQLWQTEEYADVAPLQQVRLCDTVSVYYPALGLEAVKEKVIKTVYNVLLDRYDSIELGQLQTTLAQTVGGEVTSAILQEVPSTNDLQRAMDLIRGGLGGYVVINTNAAGQPEEILIMDTPDTATAVNVIRMNKNGIGFSQSGYSGPFNSAWTIDGEFFANWIKAGVLSDAAGQNYWNMQTGDLVTKTLKATDYVYVDGTASSYFKIPYRDSTGDTDYYLELSSSGLLIKVLNAFIRDVVIGAGGGTYQPSLAYVGGLEWVYSDGNKQWTTQILPYNLWISQETIGGGNTDASVHVTPGTFAVQAGNKEVYFNGSQLGVTGSFYVSGTKSRLVETETYGRRLLYSYETPTPLFGDIGEATIDEDGFCYVDIDDIFTETIAGEVEYQVFLQKEGHGDCWVAEKAERYFVIEGTPGLKVAWELKAKQRDYELTRLEDADLIEIEEGTEE